MFPLFLAFDWYFSKVAWLLAVLARRSPGMNRRRATRLWRHRPLADAPRGTTRGLLLPIVLHAPGRPPAIYLGTDQGDFAEIVLGVKGQPDLQRIRMHVKFVIGKAN
jgi:hypothetical protein